MSSPQQETEAWRQWVESLECLSCLSESGRAIRNRLAAGSLDMTQRSPQGRPLECCKILVVGMAPSGTGR